MSEHQLRRHRRLYSRAGIDAAISAFGEICSVSVRSDGDHYLLDITDIDPDVKEVIVPELANYTLAEVVERRR